MDLCFKKFGNKVKKWITFNEPDKLILGGYEDGHLAPGRCSRCAGHCTNGNSAKEPYLAMHHLLLAHAKAVDLYRKQYKVSLYPLICVYRGGSPYSVLSGFAFGY